MIIGLVGRAGSGKDTVANRLVEKHGYTRLAFADAVRAAVLAIDPMVLAEQGGGWDRASRVIESIGWDRAKREIPEIRRLLQVVGTEVGRQILGDNCWVDIVARQIEEGKNYVITDVRFDNEVTFVRERAGAIVEIQRPNNPNAIAATHASEQLQVAADFILDNDGTLEQLNEKIDWYALILTPIPFELT